jgi:hypothetical protein
MLRVLASLCFLLVMNTVGYAQQKKSVIDSTEYYNDLFNELDSFLDSLTAPRTFFIVNTSFTNNFLNFSNRANTEISRDRKLTITPSIGYYHKSGLGLTTSTALTNDGEKLTAFQYVVSGSYDYLRANGFLTGVNLTHIFTKDSLPFYTSPIQNEASFYFTIRRSWIKPSITATYGWGSRTAYEEQKQKIKILRGPNRNVVTTIETEEKVSDFTISTSFRHDFYWLDKLGPRTGLRFTPQLIFTGGTQRFGFNQTSNSYILPRKTNTNVLYSSENVQLDDQTRFQPLSITAFLKAEASWHKLYIQPQLGFDYYLPAKDNNLSTMFVLNVGTTF